MRVSAPKSFEFPSEDVHRATAVEVVHKGKTETEHGKKDQLTIVWRIDDERSQHSKDPLTLKQNMTNKVHPRSDFYRLLRALDIVVDDFDMDDLIGKHCLVDIRHTIRGKNTYADIVAYPKRKTLRQKSSVVIDDALSIRSERVEEGA